MTFVPIFILMLGIGGLLAEFVLPKIKPLNDWIERLADEKEEWQ